MRGVRGVAGGGGVWCFRGPSIRLSGLIQKPLAAMLAAKVINVSVPLRL